MVSSSRNLFTGLICRMEMWSPSSWIWMLDGFSRAFSLSCFFGSFPSRMPFLMNLWFSTRAWIRSWLRHAHPRLVHSLEGTEALGLGAIGDRMLEASRFWVNDGLRGGLRPLVDDRMLKDARPGIDDGLGNGGTLYLV